MRIKVPSQISSQTDKRKKSHAKKTYWEKTWLPLHTRIETINITNNNWFFFQFSFWLIFFSYGRIVFWRVFTVLRTHYLLTNKCALLFSYNIFVYTRMLVQRIRYGYFDNLRILAVAVDWLSSSLFIRESARKI